MRRSLQGRWAIVARLASRHSAGERRAAGVGCCGGLRVLVGRGALGLCDPGLGLELEARRTPVRTVLPVGDAEWPSCLVFAGGGVAGGAALGHAPLRYTFRGARGPAPGLPGQAFRRYGPCPARGLGLRRWIGFEPSPGQRLWAQGAPATDFELNPVSAGSGPRPDTAVCGGRDQSLMPRRGRVVLEVDPAARGARGGPSGLRPRPADPVSTPPGLRSAAQPLALRAA
jgi:hypothetical protein